MQPAIPFGEELMRLSGVQPGAADKMLMSSLLWIGKFAFDSDYSVFRRSCTAGHSREEDDDQLQAYRRQFLSGERLAFFNEKYPLLHTLLGDCIASADAQRNAIASLYQQDRQLIADTLFAGSPIGAVREIVTGMGDTHQEGKSTAIVHLDCGRKLVYKPRSGSLDLAFGQFLQELETALPDIQLKAPKLADRTSHFWMEYIRAAPCTSEDEIKTYYTRAGALLAIVYLLGGMDMHYENVIASGSYPVLIDIECLFQPFSHPSDALIKTCMLPFYIGSDSGMPPGDISGLGAGGEQYAGVSCWNWKNRHTNAMELDRLPISFHASENQPMLNGRQISPEAYFGEIVRGFTEICRWTMKLPAGDENNPFAVFRNCRFRILLRTTKDYRDILENSYLPEAFASPENRRRLIRHYLREFPANGHPQGAKKAHILRKEREAIERQDIPYFEAETSGTCLLESNRTVLNSYFTEPPYETVMRRIRGLHEREIETAVSTIVSLFAARYGRAVLPAAARSEATLSIAEEAGRLAASVAATAIRGKVYSWNGLAESGSKPVTYRPIGNGLYGGTAGISFFLAAWSAYRGNETDKPLIDALRDELVKAFRDDRIGSPGCEGGLAGIIYSLSADADRYREVLLEMAAAYTESAIAGCDHCDVMNGVAGWLVVLTGLYRKTGALQILRQVGLLADALLAARITDGSTGCRVWLSPGHERPLTGFAHGASGIGYALLRAFELTGTEAYKAAFYEALRYEDCFYDKKRCNWADQRGDGTAFHEAWCYGAPGTGLCRLYAYRVLRDERLLDGVRDTVEALRRKPLADRDFYCCGNVSRIDFLIEAAEVLEETELRRDVHELILQLMKNNRARRFYRTYENPFISLENPSLFRGVAGIGYVLLRYLDPQRFPSFGIFE